MKLSCSPAAFFLFAMIGNTNFLTTEARLGQEEVANQNTPRFLQAYMCEENFQQPRRKCSSDSAPQLIDFVRQGACASTTSNWRDCNNEANLGACMEECERIASSEDSGGCCSYRAHLASGSNPEDPNTGKYGCLYHHGSSASIVGSGNTDEYASICKKPDTYSCEWNPHRTCSSDSEPGLVDFKRQGACASTTSNWRDCNNEDNIGACMAECERFASSEDSGGCCSYRAHLASGSNPEDPNTGKYGCLYHQGSSASIEGTGSSDSYGAICVVEVDPTPAPTPEPSETPTESLPSRCESPSNGCCVCGEGRGVINPDALFFFPGQRDIACGDLEEAGLNGHIGLDQCSFLPSIVSDACGCE